MVNLVALVPALVTAGALGAARWGSRGTPTRVRRWGTRALALWSAVAAGTLVALLVGLHLQHAGLAVWSAFALVAAVLAAVTAVALRLASSFAR